MKYCIPHAAAAAAMNSSLVVAVCISLRARFFPFESLVGSGPLLIGKSPKVYIYPKSIHTKSEGVCVIFEDIFSPGGGVSSSLVIAMSTLEIEVSRVFDVALAVETDGDMEVFGSVRMVFLGDGVVYDAIFVELLP